MACRPGLSGLSQLLLLLLTEIGRKPIGASYDSEAKIESARLFGNINAYAYYFTDLLIGAPHPQLVSVIIDTGSSLCGFPCAGCTHCGNHIDALYDPSKSRAFERMKCDDMNCAGSCEQGVCTYVESYTEGSSISGFWFRDRVRLGAALHENPPFTAVLGCHMEERKLFYTQKVNGIMGLAPHQRRSSILQDMFRDRRDVNTNMFSLCLAEWGGVLDVGGYNKSYHKQGSTVRSSVDSEEANDMQWIPLQHHTRFFSVHLKKLSLESDVSISSDSEAFGETVVDSGTTFSYFPVDVFNSLKSELATRCLDSKACGAARDGESCWRLSFGNTPNRFPTLTLVFGTGAGQTNISWPPDAYMFRRGEDTLWCYAFDSNGPSLQTVLGISFLLHKNVVFDLQQGRLGIAEAACPEHHRPPVVRGVSDVTTALPREESSSQTPGPLAVTLFGISGLLAFMSVCKFIEAHTGTKAYTCLEKSSEPSQEGSVTSVSPA